MKSRNGFCIRGHAPDNIVWQNWEQDYDRLPVPTGWKWSKFCEVEKKSCLYAGYENDEDGDETEYLYLRFSLKTGAVTGVKRSVDDLESVAEAWNDYDTPKGATRGEGWARYLRWICLVPVR